MHEYPKMLYRDGSALEWESRSFDYAIADDADAETALRADGWHSLDDEVSAPVARKPGRPRKGA